MAWQMPHLESGSLERVGLFVSVGDLGALEGWDLNVEAHEASKIVSDEVGIVGCK